jgi:hypothetical protein
MQLRKKTQEETKMEFAVIAVKLQHWAGELKAQDPAPLDKIDLLQRGAAAVFMMTEELFGPIAA